MFQALHIKLPVHLRVNDRLNSKVRSNFVLQNRTPSVKLKGFYSYYFFSMITNKTPVRIRIEPIQKVIPSVSPKISHPSNVPTKG